MAIVISFKPVDSFNYKSLFLFVLFTAVLGVPYHPDTRAKLHAASFSDQLNIFFDEFGKHIEYEELETTGVNLENPVADIMIKSTELNGQDLTLNVSQTLATEMMLNNSDNTVCYDDLGCITRFSFADPNLWPVNLLPESRNKIDTHFTLNTRDLTTPPPGVRISAYDTSGITAASFKATRPTKFYIHGWLSTGYEELYKIFVERLLAKGDFNVIVVHWGGGALTTYNQAYVNIRLVGLEVAFLVNTFIEKLGAKASDVHLIGHSLGAHTSGYAGNKIPNLGRITGLDPAGWYFKGMPNFVRLDPTDAQFVDAVHTDGDGAFAVGLLEPAGHVNFYPNGGGDQPGCILSKYPTAINQINSNTNLSNIDISTACSHMRAVYLYSESFLSINGCQRIGFKCSDYESFQKGQCNSCGSDNSQCVSFGLQTINYPIGNQVNVKFYFNTGGSSPYCRYHYAVNVRLAKPNVAKATISGILQLSVSGKAGTVSNVKFPAFNFQHGSDHQFLLTIPIDLGPVQKVNLRWKYVTDLLDKSCFWKFCNHRLYVNSVIIYSMNNYPEENIEANTYKNCPQFTPGVIGQHSSLDLSVDNSCTTRFNLLDYFRPWTIYY